MSYIQATEIMCDVCSNWIRVDGGKRDAEAFAKEEGWLRCRVRGILGHMCPVCVREVGKA